MYVCTLVCEKKKNIAKWVSSQKKPKKKTLIPWRSMKSCANELVSVQLFIQKMFTPSVAYDFEINPDIEKPALTDVNRTL